MRTFQWTVYGTVTADTEDEARRLVAKLLLSGLDCDAVTLDESEVTMQICVDCWCYTTAASQRCDECAARATPHIAQAG